MMDRFDLVIPVSALKPAELQAERVEEDSASILTRVQKARKMQHDRYNDSLMVNAYIDGQALDSATAHNNEVAAIFSKAIEKFNLSARGYHRLLRVTRTIADLDFSERIQKHHVLEAINYRLR